MTFLVLRGVEGLGGVGEAEFILSLFCATGEFKSSARAHQARKLKQGQRNDIMAHPATAVRASLERRRNA